jgi:hypothetical protein
MKFMVMERNFEVLGYDLDGRESWDQCCARNHVDFARIYGSFCSLSYFFDIVLLLTFFFSLARNDRCVKKLETVSISLLEREGRHSISLDCCFF